MAMKDWTKKFADFEIHYPQGQVGLVRETSNSHEFAMQSHQKACREHAF